MCLPSQFIGSSAMVWCQWRACRGFWFARIVTGRFKGGVCCWLKVGNSFVSCECPAPEGEEVQQELVVLTPAWIVWKLLEGLSSSRLGGVGVLSM